MRHDGCGGRTGRAEHRHRGQQSPCAADRAARRAAQRNPGRAPGAPRWRGLKSFKCEHDQRVDRLRRLRNEPLRRLVLRSQLQLAAGRRKKPRPRKIGASETTHVMRRAGNRLVWVDASSARGIPSAIITKSCTRCASPCRSGASPRGGPDRYHPCRAALLAAGHSG
jgi:hypothetical protein